MDKDLEHVMLRKTRLLTQALIVSGAVNIALLSTFFYFSLQEEAVSYHIETAQNTGVKSALASHQEVLKAYAALPFDALLLRLENKEHVEEGLLKRDIALASLSSVYHLDVEKALAGTPFEKRIVLYRANEGDQPTPITLYLGLADYQYQAIMNFAKTEKWPLTPKGLFFHLKLSSHPKEDSLLDAFYLTTVFENIYTLFRNAQGGVDKAKIVDILCSGDWALLEPYEKLVDFSEDTRRHLLLSYLTQGSKEAATFLLDTDAEFVIKRLDDVALLKVLSLYEGQISALEPLAKEVLKSFRSEPVRKKAASLLYAAVKEPLPEPLDVNLAIKRFLPELFVAPAKKEDLSVKVEPAVASVPKVAEKKAIKTTSLRTHTVQEGDSLWKIAKKYKVDIDALMKVNQLESEKLKPGRKLLIPESKKSS